MHKKLNQKNEFVIALREHLKSRYKTKNHYTCGESDFEAQKKDRAYCLIQRDLNKPKNISGFYFRKDLCHLVPENEAEVLKEVHNFSLKDKNIESVLGEDEKNLTIRFNNKEYLVTSYVGRGYNGDICVNFMEFPNFLKKAA
jgi:hypothetical protein